MLSAQSISTLNSAVCREERLTSARCYSQISISKCFHWSDELYASCSPGPHDVPVHSSVSLIAQDGGKIFFIGPFIDVRPTLHVALTFISVERNHQPLVFHCGVLLLILQSTDLRTELTSCLSCYLPQPFAHDCLKELPGRDLTQDLPVAVCKDGISVASWAKIRRWTLNYMTVLMSSFRK